MTNTALKEISYIDNPATKDRADHYETITVDTGKIIESWRLSLFSYEWILPDGRIKDCAELPQREQEKRTAIEQTLQSNQPLEKPVLGIGIIDNVEIGIGKATFLTLAAHGIKTVPVHVPVAHSEEFNAFLV